MPCLSNHATTAADWVAQICSLPRVDLAGGCGASRQISVRRPRLAALPPPDSLGFDIASDGRYVDDTALVPFFPSTGQRAWVGAACCCNTRLWAEGSGAGMSCRVVNCPRRRLVEGSFWPETVRLIGLVWALLAQCFKAEISGDMPLVGRLQSNATARQPFFRGKALSAGTVRESIGLVAQWLRASTRK